jgi:integrase
MRAILTVAIAESERDYLMILLSYVYGYRASEVINITAGSIRDGYITVQRKKGSKRTTQPLLTSDEPLFDVRTALLKWIESMFPQQRIFTVSRVTFWRAVQKHGRAAGVPAHLCHPHAAKHGCGMSLKENNVDVSDAQVWLGHVSGASTMIYRKPSEDQAAKAVIAKRALV